MRVCPSCGKTIEPSFCEFALFGKQVCKDCYYARFDKKTGFWKYCRNEIRKGLMFRYWITLPAMYRREIKFRRELVDSLAKLAQQGTTICVIGKEQSRNE